MTKAPKRLRDTLRFMYDELEANRLNVVLIPAPEQAHIGHKIRVAEGQNPPWYKEFCAAYPSTVGRNSTIIRRHNVLVMLKKLFTNGCVVGKYSDDLIEIADNYLETLKEQHGE